MDALKLLSRSTKRTNTSVKDTKQSRPSDGHQAQPQIFPVVKQPKNDQTAASRKRKRGRDVPTVSDEQPLALDFFAGVADTKPAIKVLASGDATDVGGNEENAGAEQNVDFQGSAPVNSDMSNDDVRAVLRQHKLKMTWLNPGSLRTKNQRKGNEKMKAKTERLQLYPHPLRAFAELGERYAVSNRMTASILDQGYTTPTEVQLGALPLLLDATGDCLQAAADSVAGQARNTDGIDLLTVAPTGSGKTLAFLIPLVHKISQARRTDDTIAQKTSAIILAPTKELTNQIVNEGRKLANGTKVRVTQFRKGMRLPLAGTQQVDDDDDGQPAVKADIIVSTPGLLHSMLAEGDALKQINLGSVRHLVLDEADVLLDPLFREQTLGIWNRLSSPDLRVSLWSATMGSNIEELARSTINKRQQQLSTKSSGMEEAPLIRLVVGLKDSAVPNIEHKLIYAATEQGKLMGLRQLLHPATSTREAGPPLLPPFLVFTQTIERAIALHSELLYDIPAEAGGISRIAVLHSDLADIARDAIMTRFRRGEIWVLITTDLLSRGVDFRGVNGVVNYDIPTSSAAYIHRVGRTGRAGREGGVAVTLYSKEDIPYLKHVANVVAMAQKEKGSASGEGMQQWLLDALPTLSKPEKQKLKKRGIESRTARGKEVDPKSARRARISSKAGFVRKAENNRKGAILGSQRRMQAELASDAGDETDFGGFD